MPHTYCLILAGGAGRRLWPVSRAARPKQFVDFFGTGRSLLQQTYDRFAAFIPEEHIYISTYADYLEQVQAQLPGFPTERIFSEPAQLSSGPAAIWASSMIHRTDPEATLIVAPCDQFIQHLDLFQEQITAAQQHVTETGDIIVVGAHPTAPNTNYGYIQKGEPTGHERISCVKSFSEKPDSHFAEIFVSSGEFVWNTGLVVWRTQTIAQQLGQLMPVISEQESHLSACSSLTEIRQHIDKYYPAAPFIAIDLLLLERAKGVRVMETNFGWADIGSWPELHKAHLGDADNNVIVGGAKVLLNGARDNTICVPDHMATVVKGLDGFLIAQEGNVLVICPNKEASLVRKLLAEAQMKLGEEYM